MKPDDVEKAAFLARTKEADHELFALVQKYRGSISAEHGIGLLKKDYLGYTRTPAEIELLRGVKRTLDPKNLFNPGKIVDV
jgi:FAD/FMN-containing dehydrogenase